MYVLNGFRSIENCQSRVYDLNEFSIDRRNVSFMCISSIDRKDVSLVNMAIFENIVGRGLHETDIFSIDRKYPRD